MHTNHHGRVAVSKIAENIPFQCKKSQSLCVHCRSVLTSASPETLREAASVVGQAWRLWVATVLRGVPNRRLSDFLRDGSRGSSTAGMQVIL